MLTRGLREQVVLVRRRLQVLLVRVLGNCLTAWDLYLDVRSLIISPGLILHLRSAIRTVKVLSRLVHDLIRRCGAHGQLHVLGRAPSG